MVDPNPHWVFETPSTTPIESLQGPTPKDTSAYMLGESMGLHANKSEADDTSCWELRKLAVAASSFVVGVSSYGLGFRAYHSSGIILEHNSVKYIVTSCYILGDILEDCSRIPSKITVSLWNKQDVDVDVIHINVEHNIVILSAKQQHHLDETTSAHFRIEPQKLGTSVSAVGRHYHHRLMASAGFVNIRGDHLECDDLMSSSCNISEWGIGGPLVDSHGNVLGMNFFSKKGFTPFLPSNILVKCVKHLMEIGDVRRPWLGLRTRSIEELDIDEFEAIYLKFQLTRGLVVKEVTEGSPADMAGIFVGDVVTSCNKTSLSSPAQFAGVLFRSVESKRGNLIMAEKSEALKVDASNILIQLVVKRVSNGKEMTMFLDVESFTPPVPTSWPVLPPPRVDNGACIYGSTATSGG